MFSQDGKRFRLSLCGYNRSAVDAEFDRLLERTDELTSERQTLQAQLDSLNEERTSIGREHVQLNTTITSMTGQVVELESNLARVKTENEALNRTIEAQKAEKSAMQVRYDQLKERDRDFSLREREFSELQSSVSSIMSVTKRATDRLFQKVVENQERVTQIAGDAAREVAAIRADMAMVREQLNETLDEVQDRIDRVDASLTGAVHKLVAIKHDDGLQMSDNHPDILSEVERLLSMKAGEVDYSDGKGYSAPLLGPYSAKFVADTAQRVNDGKITPKAVPAVSDNGSGGPIGVRRANPTPFESTDESILEATRLLERGGMNTAEYYSIPTPAEQPAYQQPIQIGFTDSPAAPVNETVQQVYDSAEPVNAVSASSSGYQTGGYCFTPYDTNEAPSLIIPKAPEIRYNAPAARRASRGPQKVIVRARKNKR